MFLSIHKIQDQFGLALCSRCHKMNIQLAVHHNTSIMLWLWIYIYVCIPCMVSEPQVIQSNPSHKTPVALILLSRVNINEWVTNIRGKLYSICLTQVLEGLVILDIRSDGTPLCFAFIQLAVWLTPRAKECVYSHLSTSKHHHAILLF